MTKWSKKKIIETIRELAARGVDISAGSIIKNHVSLFSAASSRRYFHSWRKAVEVAGINYEKVLKPGKERRRKNLRKWNKDRVLAGMREIGHTGLSKTYSTHLRLYSAARREFGEWKKALEAAGYRAMKGRNKNSLQIVPVSLKGQSR